LWALASSLGIYRESRAAWRRKMETPLSEPPELKSP
jgi:hypothetical protein